MSTILAFFALIFAPCTKKFQWFENNFDINNDTLVLEKMVFLNRYGLNTLNEIKKLTQRLERGINNLKKGDGFNYALKLEKNTVSVYRSLNNFNYLSKKISNRTLLNENKFINIDYLKNDFLKLQIITNSIIPNLFAKEYQLSLESLKKRESSFKILIKNFMSKAYFKKEEIIYIRIRNKINTKSKAFNEMVKEDIKELNSDLSILNFLKNEVNKKFFYISNNPYEKSFNKSLANNFDILNFYKNQFFLIKIRLLNLYNKTF